MTEISERLAAAHRQAASAPIASVAAYLQEALGQQLVGYMLAADPKTVGRWAADKQTPRPEYDERLRHVYHVFQLLLTEESPHTVRAWFVGMNPQLDDESPAAAVRADRVRDVLVAAKAFLSGG
jgi:hypothetical protein